jgi:hypothetical protein
MVPHELRKIRVQVDQHVLRIVVLEGPVMTPMKINKERQYLAERQRRLAGPLALTRVQQAPVLDRCKGLAEIVNIAEDRNQLVHRGSWGMPSRFVGESAQHTGASFIFNSERGSCGNNSGAHLCWLVQPRSSPTT